MPERKPLTRKNITLAALVAISLAIPGRTGPRSPLIGRASEGISQRQEKWRPVSMGAVQSLPQEAAQQSAAEIIEDFLFPRLGIPSHPPSWTDERDTVQFFSGKHNFAVERTIASQGVELKVAVGIPPSNASYTFDLSYGYGEHAQKLNRVEEVKGELSPNQQATREDAEKFLNVLPQELVDGVNTAIKNNTPASIIQYFK